MILIGHSFKAIRFTVALKIIIIWQRLKTTSYKMWKTQYNSESVSREFCLFESNFFVHNGTNSYREVNNTKSLRNIGLL